MELQEEKSPGGQAQGSSKELTTEAKIINFDELPQQNGVKSEDYFISRNIGEVFADGSLKPQRKKIIGAFLYQDTNTLLFSRTNIGKSIYSYQAGYCAATGTSLAECDALHNECEPMKTLVFDMELEDVDLFERHYSHNLGLHLPLLRENLIYLHESPKSKPVYKEQILEKIAMEAEKHQAKQLIIDNLTKVIPDLLKGDVSAMVIDYLKKIRQSVGCSFLIIGHTTKTDPRTAIKPQDYYGSAHIQNFFTEISYLDATKTDNEFMLVHSKTKRKELYYKTVPVFRRSDHPLHGIGFNFLRFDERESISLPESVSGKKGRKFPLTDFTHIIKELSKNYSPEEIAGLCDVTRQHIYKLLKEGDKEKDGATFF